MRTKLTDAVCGQKAPKKGRVEIWDTVLPGLCIRIYPSGARTFSLMPRERFGERGRKLRQRRISLWPRYPLLSLAEARRQARELMLQWQAGADPPAPPTPSETTAVIVERWLAIDQAKSRSRNRIAARVRRALAPWSDRPVADIKRRDIQGVIDGLRDTSGPNAAWNTAGNLHRLFKWAYQREYVEQNPAAGVDVPAPSPPRERVLDDDELRAVWEACDQLSFPYGQIVRLLILTGARHMEVAHLPWSELNLERAEWLLPAVRAKNEIEHLVPLSPEVMALLDALPRIDNPAGPLFPGQISGKALKSGVEGKVKKRLDKVSGVSGWRIHDIRRTVATGLQRLGVKREVTEAALNHIGGKSGIVRVYQRYEFADEKRAALEAWGRYVDRILTGASAKVINLPAKGS